MLTLSYGFWTAYWDFSDYSLIIPSNMIFYGLREYMSFKFIPSKLLFYCVYNLFFLCNDLNEINIEFLLFYWVILKSNRLVLVNLTVLDLIIKA